MSLWETLGWSGQALFFSRSIHQWWRSERADRSVAPPGFWWMSLAGTALLAVYTWALGNPILLAGLAVNGVVYARNLRLLRAPRRLAGPAAPALGGLALAVLLAGELVQRPQGVALAAPWLAVGIVGQGVWSARFVLQWVAAERSGRVDFPPVYWWASLVGNGLLLAYVLRLGEPVLIAGYALGPIVQVRNLMLGPRRSRSGERDAEGATALPCRSCEHVGRGAAATVRSGAGSSGSPLIANVR